MDGHRQRKPTRRGAEIDDSTFKRGVVDWGGFAAALADVGYAGSFIYETPLEGDTPLECFRGVAPNFRRILEAAG
ncbi:hypothetical protein FJZ36_04170 [Candidatus Poribacteria bacterium]|nr:hypothetical protein [Candidatus Poribacteria bacterium]